jgi:hypothetical protein
MQFSFATVKILTVASGHGATDGGARGRIIPVAIKTEDDAVPLPRGQLLRGGSRRVHCLRLAKRAAVPESDHKQFIGLQSRWTQQARHLRLFSRDLFPPHQPRDQAFRGCIQVR